MVVMVVLAALVLLALAILLGAIAVLGAVAVPISVAIAVSVAVPIAVSVAVTVAIAAALLVLDVIEDNGHVGEYLLVLELLQVRQHALVDELGAEDEDADVRKTLQDVGIGHDTGRDGVDEDDVVTLAQDLEQRVQPLAAEQLGRVRRQGTGEDDIHAGRDDVVLDDGLDIVRLAGEIVGESGGLAGGEVAGQGALAEVEVQQDDLLLDVRQAGRQVGRQEGLTAALHQRQEEVAGRGLVRVAGKLDVAPQDPEGLGNRVAVLVHGDDLAGVTLLAGRDFAQDRDVHIALHVLAVADLGVQQAAQQEDGDGDQQADQQAQHHVLAGVGRDRTAVDAGLVDHLGVAFDGRLADQVFLPLAQQGEIELLLDGLDAGQVVDVELAAGDLADLVGSCPAGRFDAAHLLAQGADVGHQELVEVALEGSLLQLHVLHDRVVGRAGLLVFVEFEDQVVESGDRGLDVFVFDVDGDREELVLRVGVGQLHQILGVGDLGARALHLFVGLDAGRDIGLSVIIQVDDLVLALEGGDLGLFRSQLVVQLGDTVVDEVGRLLDDLRLLVDRPFVVDTDHLVQDVRRADRRCVVEREIDDPVGGAVARHVDFVAVGLRNRIDVAVRHVDRVVIVQLPQRPGRVDDDAAVTGGDRIPEASADRVIFADLDGEARVFRDGDGHRGVVRLLEVRQEHLDRGLLVEVLHPLDDLCLVFVIHPEVQTVGHFEHRSLGLEDDDFVVDGAQGRRDAAVGDVFPHRHAVGEPVAGHGVDDDLGVALIDPVSAVAEEPGDGAADRRAEDQPVEVSQDGEEDVFAGQGVGIFFLQEGEVVLAVIGNVGGHIRRDGDLFEEVDDQHDERSRAGDGGEDGQCSRELAGGVDEVLQPDVAGDDEVILLQHEVGIIEDLGGAGVQVAHGHLAVHFAQDRDLLPVGEDIQVAGQGEGFQEGAALVGDGDRLAAVGAEEEDLEVAETGHDEGLADVVAFDQHLLDLFLEFQAGEAGGVDLAEDGKFDISVLVDEIGQILTSRLTDINGCAADVERPCQVCVKTGYDNVQFIIGRNDRLESIL